MEWPKGKNDEASPEEDYSGLFEKLYEAAWENPVDATEEELQVYRTLESDSVDTLERLIADKRYASEAIRYLGIMALAHPGNVTGLTDLEHETGARARAILFANKDALIQVSLDDRRSPQFSPLMQLDQVPGFEEEIAVYLRQKVAEANLDLTEFEEGWKSAGRDEDFERHRIHNIFQILRLEGFAPGSSRALHRQFGIVNFARYPLELLQEQFENREREDLPYGILLYPYADWNSSFYSDEPILEKFHTSLKGAYQLRVLEASDKREIARHLIDLNRAYHEPSGGQPIAFAVIGGHGSEEQIQFGGSGPSQRLHIQDLTGVGIGRARNFFAEHPTIVLVSCSVGIQGGIAQELSRTLHSKVIAPDNNTKLEELTFQNNEFEAAFRGANTQIYEDGEKMS